MIDKLRKFSFTVKINPSYYGVDVKFNRKTKGGKNISILKLRRNSSPSKYDLLVSHNLDNGKVVISGNLRKWWFAGRSRLKDLNKGDVKKALKLIAKRLGISFYELLVEFKFSYLELGGNVQMRPESCNVIQGIFGYPRLERFMYRKSSVYFSGKKYSIIFYDKLLEMSDNGEISKRCYKILSEKLFVLRYELKINAISGYKHKKKIYTPYDLLKNWDFMVNEWNEIIYRLIPVDVLSKVKIVPNKSLNPTQIFEYFAVMGIIQFGIEKVGDFINTKVVNRLSETRRKMYELHNRYKVGNNWHYFTELASATAKKAKKMKARDSIKIKNGSYL